MATSFGSMSLHLGADAEIRCSTYPDDPTAVPILTIDIPGTWLHLAPSRSGAVDAEDLHAAHELAQAIAVYVAECERLHAETNQTENDQADPSQAPAA